MMSDEKPKIDVFCAWGDGPDVGINISNARTLKDLIALDFTADEALALASELIRCATEAQQMERELIAYEREARLRELGFEEVSEDQRARNRFLFGMSLNNGKP